MFSARSPLRLPFATPGEFRSEYERNLSRGGAFVPTSESFEMREIVTVELELGFCGESLALPAEVVHQALSGPNPGVAVQFLEPAPDLRQRLEPFLERFPAEPPRSGAAAATEGAAPPAPEAKDLEEQTQTLDSEAGLEIDFEPHPALSDPDEATQSVPSPELSESERRDAPRAVARVMVQVEKPTGGKLDGRMRNVSRSGALLSVDGDLLPVDRVVRLAVADPASGEPVEIPARVVRHVEGEGVVPAVAVRFEPPEDRREAIGQVIDRIQETDRKLQREGIRGPIEEVGAASLIQMFAGFATRGTITLIDGVEEATVVFEEGQLLYVSAGSVEGTKALGRILEWSGGEFEFRAYVDPLCRSAKPQPLEGALLEAARRLDEERSMKLPELSPAASLRVERDRLAEAQALSQTEEAVLDLAAAGFSVRRILDVIPEDDHEIQAAIAELLRRGVVTPGPPGS